MLMVRFNLKIRRSNQGFTLLEIIIALSILAITMTTLLMSSSQVTRNSRYLRDKTFASFVASNIIESTRLGILPTKTDALSEKGISIEGNNTYHWNLVITQTPNALSQKTKVSVQLGDEKRSLIEMVGYRPVLKK